MVIAANAPFFTQRIFFLYNSKTGNKQFSWMLLEIFVLYFLVGMLALGIEIGFSPLHQQGWEFYVVTFCLFLVFAYPGFVYRYLWRKKH